MTERWKSIIDAISVVKHESVNFNTIKSLLDNDTTIDAQVLDNLYMSGFLTLADYKYRMSQYIVRMMEITHYAKERIERAEEEGDNYSPMRFYGLQRENAGFAIEDAIQNTSIKDIVN